MGRKKRSTNTGKAQSLADQRARILKLTQEEMARRLKVSQGYLSWVESGKSTPTQTKKWAKEYRLTLKGFQSLADNQFILPLWRFAVKDEPEAMDAKSEARTA